VDFALTTSILLGCLVLAYTFFGYAIIVHIIGRKKSEAAVENFAPNVSVVLVGRNEEERIVGRIENLLDTDHPQDSIEIVVVSDGSTDHMITKIEALGDQRIRAIDSPDHRGKPACLNDGVSASMGEFIVFADARQRFERTTIPRLLSRFIDPKIGAVSGELLIEPSESGIGKGVDAYWRIEKAIRLGESGIDSSIGCTGAVYAIRKSSFAPLPPDTLLDDVVCPMQIALSGLKVKFAPEAVAYDPQSLEPERESRRKRRTLAGNFQMLFRYPSWLLPWRNRLFIQLVSHKYLRLLAPLLLLQVLVASLILAYRGSLFGIVALAGQAILYCFALLGVAFPRLPGKAFAIPAGFVFLNLMTVRGFIEFLFGRGRVGW